MGREFSVPAQTLIGVKLSIVMACRLTATT